MPQGIANKTELLAVKDRSPFMPDSGFSLGEYTVSGAQRGWTTSTTEEVGPISSRVSSGSYTYTLAKGNQLFTGKCTTGLIDKHVDLGDGWEIGNNQNGVSCSCGDQARLVLSTAALDSTGVSYEANGKQATVQPAGVTYNGRLFIGEKQFDLTTLHEVDGGIHLPEPAGYRVTSGQDVGAMVEVLTPGRMWLDKGLSHQTADSMRCLLTGLMFFRSE
ncbi:hypothetical protein FEF65_00005 [Mariprofundus erugo]|uniref:Uncharacterized protein n=1 Tax=Mariprofundus erugo TaxID=2528639 RepID=A0A5R9GSN8_9PROT|nr:hypothetical protein [Mariprofundus erugo]TLS68930.1 hypothetical protein FEF65_00005 [Mariprofundus erugo]